MSAGRALLLAATLLGGSIIAAPAARAQAPASVVEGLQSAEGLVFDGPHLLLADYADDSILVVDGSSSRRLWHRAGCSPTGIAALRGEILVACFGSRELVFLRRDGTEMRRTARDDQGRPLREPNDFAVDAQDGVYLTGTGPWEPRPVAGRIYYRAAGGALRTIAEDLHSPNGVALSPDGKRLFVVESYADRILVFDVLAPGRLGNRRELLKLGEVLPAKAGVAQVPDGLRVDRLGRLYLGFWEGGLIAVLDPDGHLLATVDLPNAHTPSIALSADGRSLYVAAADDLPGQRSRGALYLLANPVETGR